MSREPLVTIPIGFATPSDPSPEDIRVQIDLRLKRGEGEIAVERLRHSGGNAPSHADLCRLACRIYDARRKREKMLGRKLFGEPGWDMLLALYCLPTRGERLGVTALALASGCSPTSGLRWQQLLTEDGLMERYPDEDDKRREWVRLTKTGRQKLEGYLLWLFHAGDLGDVIT